MAFLDTLKPIYYISLKNTKNSLLTKSFYKSIKKAFNNVKNRCRGHIRTQVSYFLSKPVKRTSQHCIQSLCILLNVLLQLIHKLSTTYVPLLTLTVLAILSTLIVSVLALFCMLPICLQLCHLGTGHPGPQSFPFFALQQSYYISKLSKKICHFHLINLRLLNLKVSSMLYTFW